MRLLVIFVVIFYCGSAAAQESAPEPAPDPAAVSGAIDRGIAFLAKDSLLWKEEHNCHSCHHAALVVWALREAKLQGRAVDEPVLAEMTKWMAESGDGKVGLPRPEGRPKAFNSKALYYSLALGADPQPDEVARQGLVKLLETVKADQTDDGSWSAWPDTRPPIFGDSAEALTALETLTLLPAAAAGDESAKVARDKGLQWLANTKTEDDPQAIAIRLVLWRKMGRPAEEYQPLVDRIKERQNDDGGWSQAKDMASDGWATGQALYALAHAGFVAGDPAISRAQSFLIRTQREDGGWTMTSRPINADRPGLTNLIPITGGGSAWAVLGLVRSQSPSSL